MSGHPPEWTREDVPTFQGATYRPWARHVHDPDTNGVGIVTCPRIVPKPFEDAISLSKRTLTALRNQRPPWLQTAHRHLYEEVFAANGWSPGISDAGVLERLLEINLERSKNSGS